MKDENTNWTSVDMYYKGFHVKKSVPDNIKEKLVETIEAYIKAGFKPSWNEDTKVALNPSEPSQNAVSNVTSPVTDDPSFCQIHKVKMKERNGVDGSMFYSHGQKNPDGSYIWCSGKGFK